MTGPMVDQEPAFDSQLVRNSPLRTTSAIDSLLELVVGSDVVFLGFGGAPSAVFWSAMRDGGFRFYPEGGWIARRYVRAGEKGGWEDSYRGGGDRRGGFERN